MKKQLLTAAVVFGFSTTFASAQEIQIFTKAGMTAGKAPESNFTGNVTVERLFPAGHESGFSGGLVTFEKEARTAWHSHPKGQVLIIVSGTGRVQQWGGKVMEVQPGTVVWFPAGVKHWHGATDNSPMSHYAIAVTDNGKSTDWMEKVTEIKREEK